MAKKKGRTATGDEGPEVMRVRFRRGATVAGVSYASGAKAAIPNDDEGWAAVDRGDCDLQPGPGVAGQPFPPEEITLSEAPIPAGAVAAAAQALAVQKAAESQAKGLAKEIQAGPADKAEAARIGQTEHQAKGTRAAHGKG